MNQLARDLKRHVEGILKVKAERPLRPSGENSFVFCLLDSVFERGYHSITSLFLENGYNLNEDSVSDHSGPGKVIFTAAKDDKSYKIVFEYKSYSFIVSVA